MGNIKMRASYDLNGLSEVQRLHLAIQKFKEYDVQRSKQYKLLQAENQSLNIKIEDLSKRIDLILSEVATNSDYKATKDMLESLTLKILMQRNALKQYKQSISKLKQKLEKQEQELWQIKLNNHSNKL